MDLPLINIDDLHKKRNNKIDNRKKSYDEVLRRCHHRIKITSENEDYCFCFYTVPTYIYGIPLYDQTSCILYIINNLVDNGFDVKYTHPNLIYISWYNKTNKHNKNNTKKTNILQLEDSKNKYKQITDYKPSGKFIYNKESIDLLSNKTHNLLE
jgi:hypothetical protein